MKKQEPTIDIKAANSSPEEILRDVVNTFDSFTYHIKSIYKNSILTDKQKVEMINDLLGDERKVIEQGKNILEALLLKF